MTPAARVQTAIELLDRIIEGAPAERTLTNWARNSRFAGSKDRAAVRDHVFDVLRQRNSCAQIGGGLSGRALMVGLLQLQGIDPQSIFTGIKYAPEALGDDEQPNPAGIDQLDLPEWAVSKLQTALGDEFTEVEQILRHRAPVILRVNLQKIDRNACIERIKEDGIVGVPHPLAATAIEVVEGERRVKGSSAFAEGLIELQDAGSQAAIEMLPLQDGMKIMDYCAGGGGKLLAMAGLTNGQFYAHDANPQRLRDLPVRAKRAGVQAQELETGEVTNHAPFDLVFCDVPCSGSGTWRRDPDSKWRTSLEDLESLTKVQSEILNSVVDLVAPGGHIAYATCSMLSDENHDQISRFCKSHTDWALVSQRQWTPLEGCDGFFLSVLKRI